VDWFDDNFFVNYEEMDLQFKIKKLGYLFGIQPNCKSFHKIVPNRDNFTVRLVKSPEKAFSTIRSRAVIIKRYAAIWQLVIFSTVFYPLFFLGYLYTLIREKEYKSVKAHFLGFYSGYVYILTNKFINFGYIHKI
jgi:GT2 family glycosyltransferase